jgi:hypothetical protein
MSKSAEAPISTDGIVSFFAAQELRTEADALESWYGPNAYSSFLRKHGHRPSREEAATIGRLLGGQVKAADGSMHPPLTAADRRVLKGIKSRRKAFARRFEQINRLKHALAALAENMDDPAEIFGDGSCVLDDPTIDVNLDIALSWLNRFGALWHDRKNETRATDADLPGSNQKQARP